MINVIKIEQLESTNQHIKDHIEEYEHFDVVWTNEQTKGKGRRGNTWFSNDESLTFSILLKHVKRTPSIGMLSLLMAKVVHQAISLYAKDVTIKWPNDVLIQSKKAAGILIENINERNTSHIIIGVGINVNQTEFPETLQDKAISMKQVYHEHIDQERLLKKLLLRFENDYETWQDNPKKFIDYCNQHLAFQGKIISFDSNRDNHIGMCKFIDEQGRLVIEIHGKNHQFVSGEIQHITQE